MLLVRGREKWRQKCLLLHFLLLEYFIPLLNLLRMELVLNTLLCVLLVKLSIHILLQLLIIKFRLSRIINTVIKTIFIYHFYFFIVKECRISEGLGIWSFFVMSLHICDPDQKVIEHLLVLAAFEKTLVELDGVRHYYIFFSITYI